MHVHEALSRFELQLQADGRSENTIKQYGRHVRVFASWLASIEHYGEIEDIDDQVVARFLASPTARETKDGKKKRPASTNAQRTSLKVLFGYLTNVGLLSVNPARLVRPAVTARTPPRGLRPGEEDRLLAVLRAAEGFEDERDRVLFELMLASGIRLSNALALDVEDLDLEEGVIRLQNVKGGREQRAYVPQAACEMLKEFICSRSSGPVFRSRAGKRITSRTAQLRFREVREKAGIAAGVTPHSLRHAFAMALYARTRDVLLVRDALGHASIGSSLVYARTGDGQLAAAIRG